MIRRIDEQRSRYEELYVGGDAKESIAKSSVTKSDEIHECWYNDNTHASPVLCSGASPLSKETITERNPSTLLLKSLLRARFCKQFPALNIVSRMALFS